MTPTDPFIRLRSIGPHGSVGPLSIRGDGSPRMSIGFLASIVDRDGVFELWQLKSDGSDELLKSSPSASEAARWIEAAS